VERPTKLRTPLDPNFEWIYVRDHQTHIWLSLNGWEPEWSESEEFGLKVAEEYCRVTDTDPENVITWQFQGIRCLLSMGFNQPLDPVAVESDEIKVIEKSVQFIEYVNNKCGHQTIDIKK